MPFVVDSSKPPGSIEAYGGATAPPGFLICDGASLNRADYPGLFAAIGTAYGSASGTTFNVPDFRGRFLRGVDATNLRDPGGRVAGATGGNTGNSVGSVQDDSFQGHNHRIYYWASQGVNPGNADDLTSNANFNASQDFAVREAITDGSNGTPRVSSETRSKNASVNFIIKL